MPYITFKNENALYHAEKGSTWSNHKYIRIENGRYIYPEDLEGNSGSTKGSSTASGAAKTNIKADQAAKAKAKAQYQIDYIKDIKTEFDDNLKRNSEEVKRYKDLAEKKFKNIKNPYMHDLSTEIKGLEIRADISVDSAYIYLRDMLKDGNLSEETRAACAKYIMQKMVSELATISPAYRDIVKKTKKNIKVTPLTTGDDLTLYDPEEQISKIYKEFKNLYEKISNKNSFDKEDLDEFDNIIDTKTDYVMVK